ncbi:MAG: DUF21 domain-containing protein [Calditrichaeota bacterium]|nr:MAG: DUF21 domain-containing protein [Calditrichota bacterium]
MTLLLIYFGISLFVSFLCSLLEVVLLSLTHSHIAILNKKGNKSGKILENLKKKVNRPLSAILSLNTIANTVGAAGVGAQAQVVFGNDAVAIASGVLTLAILVFSEIIPKTIGASYWKKLAPFASYAILTLIYITYPLVLILEVVSKIFSKKGDVIAVSREELLIAAELGAFSGEIQKKELRMIRNLLRLDKIPVEDIMTPRLVMLATDKKITVGQFVKKYSPIPFSRIPIYDETVDHIIGIVYRFNVLTEFSKDREDLPLEKLVSPIHAVPKNKTIANALDEFIKRQEHIFLVVDEHGGTAGIVTLEDAIETLLGVEIVDEFDSVEDMRKFALELYEKRKRKIILNPE